MQVMKMRMLRCMCEHTRRDNSGQGGNDFRGGQDEGNKVEMVWHMKMRYTDVLVKKWDIVGTNYEER